MTLPVLKIEVVDLSVCRRIDVSGPDDYDAHYLIDNSVMLQSNESFIWDDYQKWYKIVEADNVAMAVRS